MKKILGVIVLGLLWCNVSFALPECQGDINKWTSCSSTWANGNKYVGEWKKGKLHGQGTHIWANGNKYVGEYKNGYMHGYGTFTSPPGFKYVGKWKNGDKHGQGTETHPDGKVIVAIFKKGEIVKKLSTDTSTQKKIELASMIDKAKNTCKELGFSEGTEKFSDCSLKLYSQSVELAAEQNKTVVMQPQSSGSNVMTIYDPVRDSNALMNKGMKMLSGGCTLGVDC